MMSSTTKMGKNPNRPFQATPISLAAAVVILTALLVLVPAPAISAEVTPGNDGLTPVALVENTASAALMIVKDKTTSAEQKKDKLQRLFTQATDVYTVSRLVLARNWKQLSGQEQTEFQGVFCRHLSITYGRNLDNFPAIEGLGDVAVQITGQREEARGDHTVMSKITRPRAADILVDYRLRKIDGRWKIIDVSIEGVSMVSNFRSQFQEVISRHGAKNLITLLRKKDAEPAKTEDTDPTNATHSNSAHPGNPQVDIAASGAKH